MEKNERACQRTHVQNHAYGNKSRRTYVRTRRRLIVEPRSFEIDEEGSLGTNL